jgi:hypothetical protein
MKEISLSERKSKIMLERVSLPPCAIGEKDRWKGISSAEGQTDRERG